MGLCPKPRGFFVGIWAFCIKHLVYKKIKGGETRLRHANVNTSTPQTSIPYYELHLCRAHLYFEAALQIKENNLDIS